MGPLKESTARGHTLTDASLIVGVGEGITIGEEHKGLLGLEDSVKFPGQGQNPEHRLAGPEHRGILIQIVKIIENTPPIKRSPTP